MTIHALFSPSSLMSTAGTVAASSASDLKRALRSSIRKKLRSLPAAQRRKEDMDIQNLVLDSSWFKSARRLCAYISCQALREVDTTRILSEYLEFKGSGMSDVYLEVSNSLQIKHPLILSTIGTMPTLLSQGHPKELKKKLYVPRVEDMNSHMRMLHISTTEDLLANSMNILEPSPTDDKGIPREDVLMASEPVDIFLLPGLAFDRQGRRLGRGGGYYDVFLRNYLELVKERKWKKPLLIALAYSLQILDENEIPVTCTDVSVDAVVSPSGLVPITPATFCEM